MGRCPRCSEPQPAEVAALGWEMLPTPKRSDLQYLQIASLDPASPFRLYKSPRSTQAFYSLQVAALELAHSSSQSLQIANCFARCLAEESWRLILVPCVGGSITAAAFSSTKITSSEQGPSTLWQRRQTQLPPRLHKTKQPLLSIFSVTLVLNSQQ